MPRVFVPTVVQSDSVTLTGKTSHYLASVLRCRRGDVITIIDSGGTAHQATVAEISKRQVVADITSSGRVETESHLSITLLQGLLKGEKMDLVVQKATELGVNEIVPVITQRTQVRETRKAVRWQKIAEEAARQSGRAKVPKVSGAVLFEGLFSQKDRFRRGIIFWEDGGAGLSSLANTFWGCFSVALAIGPEGGFTKDEVAQAEAAGFVVASVGSRILRAETAAIAAVALIQFLAGDLGRGFSDASVLP